MAVIVVICVHGNKETCAITKIDVTRSKVSTVTSNMTTVLEESAGVIFLNYICVHTMIKLDESYSCGYYKNASSTIQCSMHSKK